MAIAIPIERDDASQSFNKKAIKLYLVGAAFLVFMFFIGDAQKALKIINQVGILGFLPFFCIRGINYYIPIMSFTPTTGTVNGKVYVKAIATGALVALVIIIGLVLGEKWYTVSLFATRIPYTLVVVMVSIGVHNLLHHNNVYIFMSVFGGFFGLIVYIAHSTRHLFQ